MEQRPPSSVSIPVLTVVVASFAACVGGQFYGFSLSGYAWLIPLVVSGFALLTKRGRTGFPLLIWIPWALVVIGWLLAAPFSNAFQRSLIMLCPLAVGVAVAKYPAGKAEATEFRRLCRLLVIGLLVVVGTRTGLFLTGVLPATSNLAAPVMTGALLASLYAAAWVFGERGAPVWWCALLAIPIIGVTRTGIVAAGLSLPMTLAPLRFARRFALTLLLIALGAAIFSSERVQRKMFYTGKGSYEDLRLDNANLATFGRAAIWRSMEHEIANKPLLGHGANASELFVKKLTGGALEHPHNDWLRLRFDYGLIGTVIYALSCLAQITHALLRARRSPLEAKILFMAGASAFLIQWIFMLTDNIILYPAFFGNLHFAMLGLAYAGRPQPSEDADELPPPPAPAGRSGRRHHPAAVESDAALRLRVPRGSTRDA